MIISKDQPLWAACFKEDGEPVFVWSRHVDLASAVEKVKIKCAEIVAPQLGSWTAFVRTPTGERVWVAGEPLSNLIARAS
jgi:hypothetical protein